MSEHPTRALPTNWQPALAESSRALIVATLLHDVWITGGVVYGEPESSMYPQQKENTEALLQSVIGQLCYLSKGPRYVAGDWNVAADMVPAFDTLREAGFVDLQDLALMRWGCPIQPTCKSRTRKDYCFVSRELQNLLTSVTLDDTVFPVHAVLKGEFLFLHNVIPKQVWLTPMQFPWPVEWDVDPEFWSRTEGTCDSRYSQLWNHIELQACAQVPFPVPKRARGRAATQQTKPVKEGKISPPRLPVEVKFSHTSCQHRTGIPNDCAKPDGYSHMLDMSRLSPL